MSLSDVSTSRGQVQETQLCSYVYFACIFSSFCLFGLLTLTAVPLVFGQTVYKSVENGVTTFSDAPPADGDAEQIELQLPPEPDSALLSERLAEMRENTDRMATDRREREQARATQRAEQLAARDRRAADDASLETSPDWINNYWPAYNRPGRFLRNRPHRVPYRASATPAKPPPGWSVLSPSNSQLQRPIVSRRH
ncbi:MAG: DUF4124 domain-containing protein [Pseudomonadota bacterium]